MTFLTEGGSVEGRLSIELLGRVCISRHDMPVRGLDPPRLRALLARLMLTPGVAIDRATLAFDFWPDSTDAQARTNLRKLLHQLLERLPNAEQFVQSNTHSLLWRQDAPCYVDVHKFMSWAKRDAPPRQLMQATSIYRGPFLPGFYDEWVLTERERLRSMYLDVLDRLASYHESRGEFAQASHWIGRLLLEAPYDEPAWERLIRMYAAAGNRAGALEAYSRCRRVLAEELGAEPSRGITEIYEQVLLATFEPTSYRVAEIQAFFLRSEAPNTPSLPLIGRLRERADVRRWCYQTLSRKRPSLVLITGEAGIGKSRLAEDTVDWALSQGVTVVATRAYQPDQALAFSPVQGLLRTDSLQTAVGKLSLAQRRQLARLMPGSTVPDPAPAPKTTAPGAPEGTGSNVAKAWTAHGASSADWQRQELFDALTRLVLAVSQPLLVVVDDLQWWDNTSINWLHYMLSHVGAVPLAVLATLRPEEDPATGFPELIAALQSRDRLRQIELDPLTPEESRHLIDEWTDMQLTEATDAHGADSRNAFAERAYAETDGNPLFLLEWLQAKTAGLDDPAGAVEYVEPVGGLPGRMHGIIMSRLLALSAPARQIVDAAAVLGRAFSWQLPGSVIESDDETLVRSLEELCRRRILREHEDGIYDFTHARIRDVVIARLSTARRRFLHKRAAEALLALYGAGNDSVAIRLAEHYEEAGHPLEAAAQYRLAARHALSVYANDEALALYRKGLDAITVSDVTNEAHVNIDARSLHASLWEGLGNIQFHVGLHDEAQESFSQAEALLPRGEIVARATLLRKKGNIAQAAQRYADAESWYGQAEATLAPLPPDMTAAAEDLLAAWLDLQLDRLNLLYGAGRIADMEKIFEHVRPSIDRSVDGEHRTRYHHSLAAMLHRRDRFVTSDEALAHGKAQLEAARAAKNPRLEAEAQFSLGFLLLWRGDPARAEPHLEAALEWAETTGDLLLRVRSLLYLGFLRRRQGDVEEVGVISSKALELARRASFNEYIALALAHRALVALRHSSPAQARRAALEAMQLWEGGNLMYPFLWAAAWPLLAIELKEGRVSDSLALAERLLSPEQHPLPRAIEAKLNEALIHWRESRADDAKASLQEALSAAREEGYV